MNDSRSCQKFCESLTFAQRYDVAVARKPLWWMGIVGAR
jgi:hypothetical protein